MVQYAALSFQSHEDFRVCKNAMRITEDTETATSSDGMFTVFIKTEGAIFPSGTLVTTTSKGREISIRVISGTERVVGTFNVSHK